jgi:nitric oxide reductase large subunit
VLSAHRQPFQRLLVLTALPGTGRHHFYGGSPVNRTWRSTRAFGVRAASSLRLVPICFFSLAAVTFSGMADTASHQVYYKTQLRARHGQVRLGVTAPKRVQSRAGGM